MKSWFYDGLCRWMTRAAVVSPALLLFPAITVHATVAANTPAIRIGSFYPNAPNGIAFITGGKSAFLLRVGWVQNGQLQDSYYAFMGDMKGYGPSASGGWYNRLAWYVGHTRVLLRWSRTGSSIVGQLQSSKPIGIALETTPSWSDFPTRYSVTGHGITGTSLQGRKAAARWRVVATSAPADEISASTHAALAKHILSGTSSTARTGTYGALVFNLKPGVSIYFAAGTGGLGNLKNASSILAQARRRYDASRVAAGGSWGNFLQPINRDINFARVYGPASNIVGYVAMRRWSLPAAQNVYEWDSFFAALQGALAHPHRSRQTIRLAFKTLQLPDGMLQNYNGTNFGGTPNRAQPPIAAMCVWKLNQRDPDIAFLRRIYPQLVKWHNWWFATNPVTGLPFRDADKNGLLTYSNGPESGMDDSPMYDNARLDPRTHTMELEDVGLNSLWAADAGYLARIAQALGKPMAAAHFLHQKEVMIRRINRFLWNPKAGIYENRFFRPQAADEPVNFRAYSVAPGKPGIEGQYYQGTNFNHLVLTRVDRAVDFNWFSFPPSPAFGGQMVSPPMTVRWQGFLTPRQTGNYRLVLNLTYPFALTSPPGFLPSVAGARLWVKGKLLINHWKVQPVTRYVGAVIHVRAGHAYPIKLEYRRQRGGAMVQLRWQRAGARKRIFSTQLSPTNFYPMIIGAPTPAMAAKMIAILRNRHKFWGRYIIPTIPRDNPVFPQQNYWRGKIWPSSNYLAFQGLKRYASTKVLNRVAAKNVALFMRNWRISHTWNENCLATGQGSGHPHCTWGTLFCLIGLEDICDIRPNGTIALNGTLHLTQWIHHVPMAGHDYDLRVRPGRTVLLRHGKIILEAKNKLVVVPPGMGLK